MRNHTVDAFLCARCHAATTRQRKMTFDYNQATTYAEDGRSPASFNAVRGAHALYGGEVNTPGGALDGSGRPARLAQSRSFRTQVK